LRAAEKIAVVFTFALLTVGCHTVPKAPSLPVRHSLVRNQLVIYSDFTLSANHRLLGELAAQRQHLAAKLELPLTDEPIDVYLFNEPESYHGFMAQHYPEFPQRRAFFVESDTRLAVYAHWGDHVAEDLRHEVAHGYLHAAVSHLPLWLDEGLAEYFEVPRGQQGFNRPHVELLVTKMENERWRPDLKRLERIASSGELTQSDYAEAWAWVHWLLETGPAHQQVLVETIRHLRDGAAERPISIAIAQLHVEPGETLAEHIRSLQ